MDAVLVLNSDYRTVLEIVSWQKAVVMLLDNKVRLVEEYAGRVLRSATMTMAFPAVVARTKWVQPRRRVRFSRKNIICRDSYTCQYCGVKPRKKGGSPDLERLTIDHVVPRSHAIGGWVRLPWSGKRARVTSWENVLTACDTCNSVKAARTPKQAKMPMLSQPRVPSVGDVARMSLFRVSIPEEWKIYLPKGSPWADYWDGELESD